MRKNEIRSFFKAIRHSDLDKVKELVLGNSEYVSITSVAPPKKDDGQSGLQVAFKTSNFEIAEFLIDQGADVNFQETSLINEWTTPVLHDCIRATVFNCLGTQKESVRFERAFALLKLMLEKGADTNATDSYGNSCLGRAFLDIRQMPIDEEQTLNQCRLVFKVLIKAGADINQSNSKRGSLVEAIKDYDMEKYNLI